MVTSLVYLQQRNVRKSKKKLRKMVHIDEVKLHIFRKTRGIPIKLSGKMCLMIMLKVTKKQSFTYHIGGQIDPPVF